jgi:hypothetical protein
MFLPLSVTYIKCHNQHSPIHIHSLDRIFWDVNATNTEDVQQPVLLLIRLNEGRSDGCNTYTQVQIVSVLNYTLRHEGENNKWVWVQFHAFLNLDLDVGNWSVSRIGRLTP